MENGICDMAPLGARPQDKAHGRDENNTTISRVLCDSLVDQAKATLDVDWCKADALVQEALNIDPGHSLAKSLRTLALDRKRQEEIERSLAEARGTQAQGDISKALQQTLDAIKLHGNDPRLSQLSSTLNREVEETQKLQGRRQAIEEVQQLEREAAMTSETDALRSIIKRADALSARYEGNAEHLSTIRDVTRRINARLEVPVPEGESTGAGRTQPVPQKPKRRFWVFAGVAGALVLLALGFWGYAVVEENRPPASPKILVASPPTTLRVQTDPESGEVSLDDGDVGQLMDGQLSLDRIAKGQHTLAIASQDGHIEITFKTTTGTLPHLEAVSATDDLRVVAVASFQS